MGKMIRAHLRNRNIALVGTWLLLLAGWYSQRTLWMLIASLLLNGYAAYLMAVDKRAAKAGRFRIPEASILLLAASGGAVGVLFGMLLFRHKTRHAAFLLAVPVFILLHLLLVYYLL
jgi:uncharacterized membrane protein YsdA (DUF1294 family)